MNDKKVLSFIELSSKKEKENTMFGKKTTQVHSSVLKSLKKLIPYIKRYPFLLFSALFSLVLGVVMTLSLPLALRRLVDYDLRLSDSVFTGGDFYLLIFLSLLLALASSCRYYFIVTLGERVVCDLKRDVFSKLLSLSPSFFDRVPSSEIVSSLVADTVQIRCVVGGVGSLALRNCILGFSSIFMMLVTSLKLSTIVLVALPIIVLPLVFFGRFVRRRSRYASDVLANSGFFASEKITNIRMIQSFTAESDTINRFITILEKTFRAAHRASFSRALLIFFAISMVFLSIIWVLWLASWDVRSGDLSPGTMGQFLLYALLASSSFGALSEVWNDFTQAAGAVERLTHILGEKSVIVSPLSPFSFSSNSKKIIEFRDVVFSYPCRGDRKILQGLNFFVTAGETVALVGSSGSGKSTLFSLLQRFYDPQEGTIFLNDVPLPKADLFALRDSMAIVPQDSAIFSGSIYENIALGNPSASFSEIKAAAQAALLDEFVDRFPNGFETHVGENGFALSGGQRQRLAIARALLKNAPILLLDEATSSLDAQSEQHVRSALQQLMKNRTTLVITHHLATIMKADKILVIADGKIIEEGKHTDLIKNDGLYAKFSRIQFNTQIGNENAE